MATTRRPTLRAGGVILAVVAASRHVLALAGLAYALQGGRGPTAAGAACLAALTALLRGTSSPPPTLAGPFPSLVLAAVLGSILVALRAPGGARAPAHAQRRVAPASTPGAKPPPRGVEPRRRAKALGAFHDAPTRDSSAATAWSTTSGLPRTTTWRPSRKRDGEPASPSRWPVSHCSSAQPDAGRPGSGPPGAGDREGAVAALVAVEEHAAVDFNLRIPSNAARRSRRRGRRRRGGVGRGRCPLPSRSLSRSVRSRCCWPRRPCRVARGSGRGGGGQAAPPWRPPFGACGSSAPRRLSRGFSVGAPRKRSRGSSWPARARRSATRPRARPSPGTPPGSTPGDPVSPRREPPRRLPGDPP